jgi:NADH-quinone oxidoreductase subunit C
VGQIRLALAGIAERVEERRNFVAVVVPSSKLVEAAQRLKQLGYDRLILVTAIDVPDRNAIRVVYHLESFAKPGSVVALETLVDRSKPKVPSLVRLWPAALLQEREQYEMLGVMFEGHPDLRRLLLPPDWPEGVHPLRKDFHVAEEPLTSTKPAKPLQELKPELGSSKAEWRKS